MSTEPQVIQALARIEAKLEAVDGHLGSVSSHLKDHMLQDRQDFTALRTDVTALKAQHSWFLGGVAAIGAVFAGIVAYFTKGA